MPSREPLLSSPSALNEHIELLEHLNNGAVFYAGKQQGKHLDLLLHLSRYSNLLLVVTGVEGSGKTHLKNRMLQQLDSGVVVNQLDAKKTANAGQLLTSLSDKLNIEIPPQADTEFYLQEIRNFSQLLNAEGDSCLITIDNAESLQQDAISLILDLANTSPDSQRPHVVLFGRPAVFEQLNLPENLRRFEAVGHHLPLQALDDQEATSYLQHRCNSVGIEELPLNATQLQQVLAQGKGQPGLLNAALLAVLKQASGSSLPSLEVAAAQVNQPKRKAKAVAVTKSAAKPASAKTNKVAAAKKTTPAATKSKLLPLLLLALVATALALAYLYQDNLLPSSSSPVAQQEDISPVVDPVAELPFNDILEPVEATPVIEPGLAAEETPVNLETTETNTTLDIAAPGLAAGLDLPDDTASGSSLATPAPVPAVVPPIATPETSASQARATPPQQAVILPPQQASSAASSRREAWLMQKPAKHYTLQLMGSLDEASVVSFIQAQAEQAAQLSYFESRYRGQPWYVVVYGDYPNRDAAVEAISRLPESLRKQQPWARSFLSVHQDIQQR